MMIVYSMVTSYMLNFRVCHITAVSQIMA